MEDVTAGDGIRVSVWLGAGWASRRDDGGGAATTGSGCSGLARDDAQPECRISDCPTSITDARPIKVRKNGEGARLVTSELSHVGRALAKTTTRRQAGIIGPLEDRPILPAVGTRTVRKLMAGTVE